MKAHGLVHQYGDNVDTDVIIPARYLNIMDRKELASHCMEDIDADFVKKVKPGDIMVAHRDVYKRQVRWQFESKGTGADCFYR